MDRRDHVLERARELIGDRMQEVLHCVRSDRQVMRGWEEPAHVRGALRRSIQESPGQASHHGDASVQEMEFGRSAGEPDRGQQRECLGQILEAGAMAVEKMCGQSHPELTGEERLGLECVLLLYVRPALLLNQGELGSVPPTCSGLERHREDIEIVQRGVGRLEMMGHPECDWAGTGFLVNETTVMTTRRTAEMFCESHGSSCVFRPGISAWMDYCCEQEAMGGAACRVRGVIGVHDRYDVALLEVEPALGACPISLAAGPIESMTCRPAYMVGFPACDSRRSEPETLRRIFRDMFGVKRVQTGQLCGTFRFGDVELMSHDCCSLGQWSGSCIVDLETHQAVGMHVTNRFLERGTAVPLYALRDDPLMTGAGVTFCEPRRTDVSRLTQQLERLSRTRHWQDLCQTIESFYERVCQRPSR